MLKCLHLSITLEMLPESQGLNNMITEHSGMVILTHKS